MSGSFEGWMPIRVYHDSEPRIDWILLGQERFSDPFFEETIQRQLRHPFHQAFRRQTDLDALRQWHDQKPGLPPRGFIFHMSRCGSTLLCRMLSALAENVVISEAPPIDSVSRSYLRNPEITEEGRADWVRWMLSAPGQKRNPAEQHLFVKFDAWSIAELPVIRRAFPDVPWIFLYRAPLEVLVSHLWQPALWTLNGFNSEEMPIDEHTARAIARVCEAGLRHCRQDGGFAVNYERLPEFACAEFPDFVGISLSRAARDAMKEAALENAKSPGLPYEPDKARKQTAATERVRDLAARWLDPIFEQLEHLDPAVYPHAASTGWLVSK